MCKTIEDYAKAREEAREEITKARDLVTHVKYLMDAFHCTLEKACEAFHITMEDYDKARELISSKTVA